jgi:dCMP deaminase
MTDWDARWLELANEVGSWSKDPTTKVGCVVIGDARQLLTAGYNGLPRGVNDDIEQRYSREERNGVREKLRWTEHAERNAIYNAARHGVSLHGSVMYVPLFPCCDCARAVIQAGLKGLVTTNPDWDNPFWKDSWEVSLIMMTEAQVEIRYATASTSPAQPPAS